jgi:RNA polymerase sigma-70 factor (ECF subfamily)
MMEGGAERPDTGRTAARAAAEPANDRDLVLRAQRGDQGAFRALVERHGDRVYALALRIVRTADDAEEVAQDAFVRAWKGLPRFRGDSAFSSWMYRITARLAFDRAARLRGRRGRETQVEAIEEVAGHAASDEGDRARGRQVERLVAGLPDAQRLVVTLYYLQDRSVEEVARTLRMPENTVKTHLSRARAALRAAWPEGPAEGEGRS